MGSGVSKMKRLVVVSLFIFLWVFAPGFVHGQRPGVVKVGAIFTYDSVIGGAAKAAMEAAASDINNDPTILNGTELRLILKDANSSVFLGSTEAFQIIEEEVVAIMGPQSSSIAHMISSVANGLQVPLISYAATDPTLSALQFPYFIRSVPSDAIQMAAIADFIDFYEWKEVITIYVDDDNGRNGISALQDALEKKMIKISRKLALSVTFDLNEVTNLLKDSKLLGPRVYVIHVSPDPRLRIFAVAEKLQMMSTNYVWIASDWFSATLDSFFSTNRSSLTHLQGIVTFRQHTPDSVPKRDILSRWSQMQQKGVVSSGLNSFALYAYDTVWAVAYSIDKFLNERNVTFSSSDKLLNRKATELQFAKLKIFDGGNLLRKKLLQTNFTGLTGNVQFGPDRNILSNGYQVINIDDKMEIRKVGYWSDQWGFSVLPPEDIKRVKSNHSRKHQKLGNIMWPGRHTERPRGWVIADEEKPLRIGVPKRASFVDFASEDPRSHQIKGYCIDIFREARNLVPYDVPYEFVPFGDGKSNPNYNQLVKMVANDVLGAAVGDIAIVTDRTKMVDFSQPYVESGLVILAPVHDPRSGAWVFLKPFTLEMWCLIVAAFFTIAVVMWILEHRVNDDFRGPPKRQIATMFLFSFSTLYKRNQENTVSALGRLVMLVWLFLLLVITSSYTANLSSILTIEQLSEPIKGIDSLAKSDWPIGYQVGSFSYRYLLDSLHVQKLRLVPLASPEEYERALRRGPDNGGVAAIVDEIPYVEEFLKKQTDFGIVGQPFSKSGWGFAFQRESPLAVDMSTAILKLAETGRLQKIHERWFCKTGCPDSKSHDGDTYQLHLSSFWGLYMLCGVVSLTALFLFFVRMIRQYIRYKKSQRTLSSSQASSSSSRTRCSEVVFNFCDFIDEREEAIKNMFAQCENPQSHTTSLAR